MAPQLSPPRPDRLVSLDGLRGVAAVVVLLHHLALTFPQIANTYLRADIAPPPGGSLAWWFTSTPAQLLIAGPEAVAVFFVISGLALTLPVTASKAVDWVSYYPQRIARLYLPVVASVLLAVVWILVIAEDPQHGGSQWLAGASFATVGPAQVLSAMDVLFGDTSINNVLWSLRWEVVFSLALPAFVVLALWLRRKWIIALAGVAALVLLGQLFGLGSLIYLPMFLLGAMVAVNLGGLRAWVGRRSAAFVLVGGLVVLIASILLLTLHWMLWSLGPQRGFLLAAARSLVPFGALGFVALAAFWPPAMKVLGLVPFRWLGRVSFSLYLVHVPIIVAVHSILGSENHVLAIALSAVVAFAVAELFSRFVEVPAHRLSKRIGAGASSTFARVRAERESPVS
jgi:peptidoglycan/LPS O-acetylase OafA/YrhL